MHGRMVGRGRGVVVVVGCAATGCGGGATAAEGYCGQGNCVVVRCGCADTALGVKEAFAGRLCVLSGVVVFIVKRRHLEVLFTITSKHIWEHARQGCF
jgi:hypothetical protein